MTKKRVSAFLCGVSIVFMWAWLVVFAHQSRESDIALINDAFGWVLFLTCLIGSVMFIVVARAPRQAVIRLLAGFLVLTVIILILEIPAALRVIHWPLVFEKLAGDGTNFLWAYRHDSELSYRRRPNDHWSGRPASDIERGWSMPSSLQEPITFTYDCWGYRNPQCREKADIVLLGDSYVEGAHVSDEQTVARRLEERLQRPVQNLGVAGYGTQQEFIVLVKEALRFEPEVIVWFFFEGNDLYDDVSFENSLPDGAELDAADHVEGMQRYAGWRQRSFGRAMLSRLRMWAHPIVPNRAPLSGRLTVNGSDEVVYFADYAGVPWDDWVEGRWQKSRDTLTRVVDFAREYEIRVIFGFVPIKYRVYKPFVEFPVDSPARDWALWPLQDEFFKFCDAAAVECMNLTELFQSSVRAGGMPYWPTDTHWSPEGHELVAGLLATKYIYFGQ